MYIVCQFGNLIPSGDVKKLPWVSGGRNTVLQDVDIQLLIELDFWFKTNDPFLVEKRVVGR